MQRARLLVSVSALAGLTALFVASPAFAQKRSANGDNKDSKGNALGRLIMLHDLEATRQIQLGRARAKQGDCKGALDAFDAGLKGSSDPTVRRDRGICHENLGHPYPAMADYRAYLTALPDAPDSPDIRQRLERLQDDSRNAEGEREREDETSVAAATGTASFSVKASTSGGGASASANARAGAASGGGAPTPEDASTSKEMNGHDAAAALERKEAALAVEMESRSSALRGGTGAVVGVFAGPRWFMPNTPGAVTQGGYMVGATLRYSMGPVLSPLLDVGYTGMTSSDGVTNTAGGFMIMGGAEARIRLDPHVNNAIIAGA
ncbi:MAG: tetratricopeptide repeat protein, partial [Polyangiaceae bacterium]